MFFYHRTNGSSIFDQFIGTFHLETAKRFKAESIFVIIQE